jgi:hypothetical protein
MKISVLDTQKHRQDIIELWRRNLPKLNDSRFNWFYRDNPAGSPLTVVAEDDNGSFVGSGSLSPARLAIGGVETQVAVASDFSVDEKHRTFGPALKIQRTLAESSNHHGSPISIAFPNSAGKGVFQRVGYQLLGEASLWIKPLRTKDILEKKLKSRVLAGLTAPLVDTYFKIRDTFHFHAATKPYAIQLLQTADTRFDELWQSAKDSYHTTLVRSSQYINWRYAAHTVEKYELLCLFDKSEGRMSGYCVFSSNNDILSIYDAFGIRSMRVYLALLLSLAHLSRARKLKSIVIGYLGDEHFDTALHKAGFMNRGGVNRYLFGYIGNSTAYNAADALNQSNWFIFEGDMDI